MELLRRQGARFAGQARRQAALPVKVTQAYPARVHTSGRQVAQQRQQRDLIVAHAKKNYTSALLFDCDGVIVETEELHRKAYNAAFAAFECTIDGKPLVWSVEYYDVLQNTVGGGKPKMKWHFNRNGWPASKAGPPPATEEAKNKLVDDLQDCKTDHYKVIVESAAEARPGVLELMDEGLARGDVAMAICSAATKEGFEKVVNSVVGKERLAKFDLILAGDDVPKKKPDPLIYNLARERLGVPADRCVVIEDSLVGLRAAKGAGMHCIITPTTSTASADFCGEGAAAVVQALKGPNYKVSIDDIFGFVCDDKGVCEAVPDVHLSEGMCAIPWETGKK
ncbi:hypothetical protein CHLRE_14g623000v5 [Chlamydomonas reinhardtii]|uniref:Uncharacterized protein n=1 Tax=Chlamydomonas reinhardtii TaxID=3055 RepID=A0A2K3CY49_CHLRE|nr:haloacid dehalogenase-like hydrolase family protein [Chlamydomonas reinhardtii]PNW73203.1 hypothetical protein CHLRE_14g623000v5 [Chlamydomonas reinhardtii]